MSNPLFGMLSGGMSGNIMQMLPQIKQNPLAVLQRVGLNVPANMNNPNDILNHLIQSGQVNQSQLDYAQKMAQTLGLK